jgi:hypothetical protein
MLSTSTNKKAHQIQTTKTAKTAKIHYTKKYSKIHSGIQFFGKVAIVLVSI